MEVPVALSSLSHFEPLVCFSTPGQKNDSWVAQILGAGSWAYCKTNLKAQPKHSNAVYFINQSWYHAGDDKAKRWLVT